MKPEGSDEKMREKDENTRFTNDDAMSSARYGSTTDNRIMLAVQHLGRTWWTAQGNHVRQRPSDLRDQGTPLWTLA